MAIDYSHLNSKGTGIACTVEIRELDGEKLQKPVRAVYYLSKRSVKLKPGDQLSTHMSFVIPEDTEDFAGYTYYKTRRIDATAFGDEQPDVAVADRIPLRYFPKVIRCRIIENIQELLPKHEAGFLTALLTGDKTDLSVTLKEEMRITGLSHTIAISGMHVSFLVGLIVLLVGKKRAPFVAIPVMFIFVLVVGGTPSVVWAFIMQSFVLLAPLMMREADSMTSLLFALFAILLMNPYAVGDVGLQLSFSATLGLVLFSGKLDAAMMRSLPLKAWKLARRAVGFFVSILAATLSAMVFTLPLVAMHFQSVSLISPVANVLVIWAITALFCAGALIVGLSFMWMGAAKLAALVLLYLVRAIRRLGKGACQPPLCIRIRRKPGSGRICHFPVCSVCILALGAQARLEAQAALPRGRVLHHAVPDHRASPNSSQGEFRYRDHTQRCGAGAQPAGEISRQADRGRLRWRRASKRGRYRI